MVALFGGVDEFVVRAFQQLHHRLEQWHVAVEQLPRRQAFARGGLLNFLSMLVGSGEEKHVVTVEPHEAGDRVGGDRLVGVADMRRAVGVGNRRGDVIGLGSHGCYSAPQLGAQKRAGSSTHLAAPLNDQRPGRARPRTAHRYQPRVASASKPNTLNTKGFRSKL